MKTMTVFEAAMCCPTGLCGVGINPDLMRLAAVIDNLRKNGVKIERYNLNSAPRKFLQYEEVNRLINEKGTDILPVFMFDNKIEITGRYPTNAELVMHLNISPEFLKAPKQGGCGCGDKDINGKNKKGCC